MTGKLLEIPFITREMVQANRGTIFVFGDNIARWGLKGQAAAMRGEPNSLGIPTKRTPYIFMDNSDLQRVIPIVDAAFEILTAHLLKGGDVVWPKHGIGSGLAQLSTRAPAIDAYIKVSLERLKSVAMSTVRSNGLTWSSYDKLVARAAARPKPGSDNYEANMRSCDVAAEAAAKLEQRLIAAGIVRDSATRRTVRPTTTAAPRPTPPPSPVSVVKKVISGGQTGADVGGLRAAKALGLQTGGWAATVGGVRWATQHKKEADIVSDPSLRTLYGMRLHPETGWVARTEQNVADSDGTLWFGKDSPGFDATRKACKSKGKKDFLVFWSTGNAPPDDAEFVAWLQKNNIQTLNVAGNREGSSPGIGEAVALFLTVALPKAVASGRSAPQDDDGAAPLPPREKRKKVKIVDLPIFDWGYDLALAGKKTLTTRSPEASDAIGLDVGESGRARLIVGKGKKKDRKIVGIYIRRMGEYATGTDLIAAAGGMAEYQRKEGGDTVTLNEEGIKQLRGWSLFELSRSPFRAEDAGTETEESSYPSIPLPVSTDMMDLVKRGDKSVEILKANVRPGHYVSDFGGTRVYVYAYYPFEGKSLIDAVATLSKNARGRVASFVSDLGYTLVEKRLESAPAILPNMQADSVRKEQEEGKDVYYVKELVKKGAGGKRVELTDPVALNFLRAGVATPGVPVSAWDESPTGFQAFSVSVHPLDRSQTRGAERQKDASDLVLLEACADADRTDLYVLPITPRRLWAYLKTTILYLSDREDVAQTIAGSSSFLDAANTLRKKYRLDNYTDGAPDFADDGRVGWQTRDLIYLRLNRIPLKHGASWDELKTDQVPAGYGWKQNGAVRPLNFGIFGACFGAPGSNSSLICCFGSGVKRLGAQSLTQAYALWDASVHRGRAVPLPYIFRRSATGEPYALVVSGKRDAWSRISPGESDESGNVRPKEWDNLSIYYAMLNVAKGAKDSPLSVCLLLPESDPDAEKDEISANAFKAFTLRMRVPEYQQSLFNDLKQMEGVGRYVTPERSHRSMISRETFQESDADKAYRAREAANTTAQRQLRDHLPVFREELCSDFKYFGNHQLVLEWPAVYLGALTGNAFTPGWLRNEYSREQVQQYITKEELQLEDFVAATQDESEIKEAYGKLRSLRSVPSRYVPEDEAEEAPEKIEPFNLGNIVAEEWAEITFIQDLVSDGKSIAEALDYAPLVPGRIILFRSGEPDVVTQKRSPIPVAGYLLVPEDAWKTYFLVRDKKVQVEAPPGEKVKNALPTVVATVSLFRESGAKIGAGKRAGEALALLKKYTEKLPGFEFDPWYLGVPAAWVNMTPVSDPPKPPELRFYPYYCGIGNIRNVAQNFLRVKVTSKTDGSYGLQPYSKVWSTPAQPYLLDRLPYADAEEKMLAKKENRAPVARAIAPIGSPAFRDEIAAAFKDSRTPDVVVTGKAAVWVGMASSGGTARGGHRPMDASLAVKTAYRQRGLYQLVNKSLQLRSEKPYRDVGPDDRGWSFRQFQDGSVLILAPEEEKRALPEKPGSPIAVYVAGRWGKYTLPGAEVSSRGGVGSLHAILRSNWMDILRFMNIFRKSEGQDALPADPNAADFTTCPIDEESPDEASVRLEIEALSVLRDWSSGKLAKDLIRVYWRNVLVGINARRAAGAEAPLSSDYPCPIRTESEKREEDRITKEALAILQSLPANAAPAKGKELRFIRDNWDAIRSRINAERATRKGIIQIPEFVPCPIRSAAEAAEDERVEHEALAVFGATELGKTAYGYSLLASRDAMRPWNDDAEKRYLPQDYSDNIHDSTLDKIRAIENGQRSSRRPRWRDRNTAVQNPITQDEYKALEAWARKPNKGKKGEKSTEAEIAERIFEAEREQPLDPYRSDTSYAEGVRAFFPQRSFRSPTPSMKTLTPASRFSVLRDHDVVTRFDDPELPTKEADERLKRRIVERKEALGDEDIRKYVGEAARMSATGALRLHQDRHRSKVEGHVVSPSGALCRRYRNSSRLKDYTPPAQVTEALTCWIVVAPPEGGHAARVMSFRNGAHIDCDMEVRAPRQLPAHIAKSIEGMILWLAEKEMRMLRIANINIAQVGSPVYRVLWSRGMSTSLDVKTLLEEAYKGDAKKAPWNAEKDLANYLRAAKAAVSAPYAASFQSQNDKESTSQAHEAAAEAEEPEIPYEEGLGE